MDAVIDAIPILRTQSAAFDGWLRIQTPYGAEFAAVAPPEVAAVVAMMFAKVGIGPPRWWGSAFPEGADVSRLERDSNRGPAERVANLGISLAPVAQVDPVHRFIPECAAANLAAARPARNGLAGRFSAGGAFGNRGLDPTRWFRNRFGRDRF
jgi:hypothetical protein